MASDTRSGRVYDDDRGWAAWASVIKNVAIGLQRDLWRLLESEAARAGVTVAQYIADAAVARAVAAAHGEEPFPVLAGTGTEVRHQEPSVPKPIAGPPGTGDETNVEYVARLWKEFRAGGVPGIAALVPEDAEWEPYDAGAQRLSGTQELQAFWASRKIELPIPTMFHAYGPHVLVISDVHRPELRTNALWSVYRFEGRMLTRAVSFDNEPQAIEALTAE